MKLGRVAIDGSKLKANARKHKAMSYERMKSRNNGCVRRYAVSSQRAEAIDAEEDAQYGPDRLGDESPAELQRREECCARIRQAQRALEERARAEAEAKGKGKEERAEVKPDPKTQHNFSDPESRIRRTGRVLQG